MGDRSVLKIRASEAGNAFCPRQKTLENDGSAGYGGVPVGKPMTRALRRLHRRRLIRHARSIFAGDLYDDRLRAWAEKRHDHLCRCKCYVCHNKRKKFGRTIQERRAFQGEVFGEGRKGGRTTRP